MIYQLLIVLVATSTVCGRLFTSDATEQHKLWEDFKRDHKRGYASVDEESKRFGHFLENLKLADSRNEAHRASGGADVHGITKYFDSALKKDAKSDVPLVTKPANLRSVSSVQTLSLVDWTNTYTTPVNDEGYCSGSWAFSAVQQIESDAMRTIPGFNQALSAEQVIQCTAKMNSCNGGNTKDAYDYVQHGSGGIAPASAYPYTSYNDQTGQCSASKSTFAVVVKDSSVILTSLGSSVEQNMASYVQQTGPLSVCLVTAPWVNTYTGGVITGCGSSKTVDACAQIVGVDTSANPPYWKVRGTWGADWGEDGYFRLAYGSNACDITYYSTYTTVKSYN